MGIPLLPDDREIRSRVLLSEPGLIIEQVELTLDEMRNRLAEIRKHVLRIDEEGYAVAPPQPDVMRVDSVRVSGAAARKLMGFDVMHARGAKGKGETIAVHDTGITSEQIERLKREGRFAGAFSTVPGGDGLDNGVNGHGPWCIEAIMAAAPEARIMSVQVLDPKTGSGNTSWIIEAGQIAKREGATVNSRSLGGPGDPNDAMSTAVNREREFGISCPCAAGNDQDDHPGRMNADEHHPGCAERAITVGARDSELALARFSSWGHCVDVSAVGVLVEAGGVYMSGTSMATPFVAAEIACLRGEVTGAADMPAKATAAASALYAGCVDSAYEQFKEGLGFINGGASLDRLAPRPEVPVDPGKPVTPAPPAAYLPGLPRLTRTQIRDSKIADLKECAVQGRETRSQPMRDLGHFVPKG